ncbi:MAG: hypothetical protein ACYS72_02855 [Planctomycetota bacterium]|jgi:hypothetical protein
MMIGIFVTGCVLAAGFAAVWFSPRRSCLLQIVSAFDRFRFICRVEQLTDESLPSGKDQFFRVEMIGRIPTDEDNVNTDVQLEIQDITEGRSCPQQVLSTDEQYRCQDSAGFHFIQHNGIVPEKNSVLARWATVAQFPCHVLRFSHRGRRKLMFCVSVLEAETGRKLITDQKTIEYVYCSDGYHEVHTRRCDILKSCVELAVLSCGQTPPFPGDIQSLWTTWLQEKSDPFMSAEEAKGMVEQIARNASALAAEASAETLLAYGQSTDAFLAMELAMQTAGSCGTVTLEMYQRIARIAEMLQIRQDRFLAMAQKILLNSGCHIEEPSYLLGISPDMDEASFRKRLNEEYRKWNARVTHPDEHIRGRADTILTLIANIRTQRFQTCS